MPSVGRNWRQGSKVEELKAKQDYRVGKRNDSTAHRKICSTLNRILSHVQLAGTGYAVFYLRACKPKLCSHQRARAQPVHLLHTTIVWQQWQPVGHRIKKKKKKKVCCRTRFFCAPLSAIKYWQHPPPLQTNLFSYDLEVHQELRLCTLHGSTQAYRAH